MIRSFILLSFLLIPSRPLAQTQYIEAGSGGGFSGNVTVYRIQPDGKVFSGKGIVDIKFNREGTIKKSKAAKLCEKAQHVVMNQEYHKPGNTYNFITTSTDTGSNKITWSEAAQDVPKGVKKLYKKIMSAVKSVQFADR